MSVLGCLFESPFKPISACTATWDMNGASSAISHAAIASIRMPDAKNRCNTNVLTVPHSSFRFRIESHLCPAAVSLSCGVLGVQHPSKRHRVVSPPIYLQPIVLKTSSNDICRLRYVFVASGAALVSSYTAPIAIKKLRWRVRKG